MGKNDRTVSKRTDGTWVNKKDGAERAAGVHQTQAEAAAEAKAILQNSGGGELKIKNEQGKIRSKDTIAPGNESSVKTKNIEKITARHTGMLFL